MKKQYRAFSFLLHPDKCKVLSAGKQKTQQYKYSLCNTELQYTNKEKDILEKAKKLKVQYKKKGYKRAKLYKEIAKELEDKRINSEI